MCWWGCVDEDDVVEMVLCRWCVWWCSVDGVVCMELQVLRLPRKTSLRCSKCCAYQAKQGSTHSQFASLVSGLLPTFRRVLEVLPLPRKTNLRCSECCACHAKRAWGAPTQNEAAPIRITRRQTSADPYEGAPNAAPATQKEPEVLQVQRLPRETNLRCSRRCACQAKRAWGVPSAAPPIVPKTFK